MQNRGGGFAAENMCRHVGIVTLAESPHCPFLQDWDIMTIQSQCAVFRPLKGS